MYATSEHVRLLKRESRQRIKVRDALSVTQAATARLDAVQYLPLAPVPGTSYPGCVLPPHLPLDPVPGTSYPGCMLPPPLWNAPVWTTSYAYGVMPPWHEVPLLLPAPEVQPVVPTHGTSHTTYAHPSQTAAPAAQEAPAASPATATTMVETPAAAGVPETPAPEDDPPYLSIAPFGVRALPVSADRVFPPDQAPGLIAPAFQRIWACALEYGLDPMNNTGKLRGGDEAVQRRLHERLAQAHLGLKGGEKMQQCGALHGGFTAMGGSNPQQMHKFRGVGNVPRQLPYEWSMEKAIDTHDGQLRVVLTSLQYSLEYLMLLNHPAMWLECYELFGDLDEAKPRPGRLWGGMNNQWARWHGQKGLAKRAVLGEPERPPRHPRRMTLAFRLLAALGRSLGGSQKLGGS